MQTGVLREQEMLRDIREKPCNSFATTGEIGRRSAESRSFALGNCRRRSPSSSFGKIIFLSKHELSVAFSRDTRVPLHPSHLIQGR
jgi:hypothetical protein